MLKGEDMKRTYHGWIYIEKEPGLRDHFSVQYKDETGHSQTRIMGYAAEGAAEAVDFFETTLGLGPIKLENTQTPLGLRVFTVDEPLPTQDELVRELDESIQRRHEK